MSFRQLHACFSAEAVDIFVDSCLLDWVDFSLVNMMGGLKCLEVRN